MVAKIRTNYVLIYKLTKSAYLTDTVAKYTKTKRLLCQFDTILIMANILSMQGKLF